MGKSGGTAQITDYTISMHIGICAAGDGLELVAIKVGGFEAWRGSETAANILTIDQPNLFGGKQKEGGVSGLAWWLPGSRDQVLPETLCRRLGLTSTTTPGFRGFASLFFTGTRDDAAVAADSKGSFSDYVGTWPSVPTAGSPGFLWVTNNPYLKKIGARVRRAPVGLNPAIALISIGNDSKGNPMYSANAVHIIFEALTNREWGMGESYGAMNIPAWEDAAQTIYNEGFGLNIAWTRQASIERFVGEVIEHINAAVYVDQTTGKHTIKLLRGDYDPLTLPTISESNALLSKFRRKMWGEIANEVVVSYTDAETGESASVGSQDLGAISMQGGLSSASKNYYGIPTAALATQAADRDVAMMAAPIATCSAEVSRELWATIAGDVINLTWPEHGITSSIMRVSNVDKKPHTVTFDLYEDIFGLALASYLSPAVSGWSEPSSTPAAIANYQVGTLPAYMMTAALGVSDPSAFVYPESMSALLVAANTASDTGYKLAAYGTSATGASVLNTLGDRALMGSWLLGAALVEETTTLIGSPLSGYIGTLPSVGQFIAIGTGADQDTEIVIVTAASAAGWTVARGMLDTVPKAWGAGTRAFVIPLLGNAPDSTVRSAFEVAAYKFLTQTTSGILDTASAPTVNDTLSERPYLPLRPANTTLGGVAFGTVAFGAASSLDMTWVDRNRILEVTQALLWTDAGVSPEAGQTTRITVTPAGGSPVVHDGVTSPYAVLKSDLGVATSGTVKIEAVNGTYVSLQGMIYTVTL